MKKVIRYSEAFTKQVVDEIGRGKFTSPCAAQKAYGIRGNTTVTKWIRIYGREDLLPKRIRIETMEEVDQLKEARKRIKELEAALADAHIDHCLEHAFLEIACERIFGKPGGFRNLRAYRLAELCDDFTCRFCERYIPLSAVDRSVPL